MGEKSFSIWELYHIFWVLSRYFMQVTWGGRGFFCRIRKKSKKQKLFLKNPLLFLKKYGIIYPVAQGYSSVGRVLVSKTMGRGFESFCPCQSKKVANRRPFLLWQEKREREATYKPPVTERFQLFIVRLAFRAKRGGVQSPSAPAKKKAIRVSEWLFSVKFVPYGTSEIRWRV